MTVGTVGVHGHVAHQPRFRKPVLDGACEAQVEIVPRHPVRGVGVLQGFVHRGEQHEGRHPQLKALLHLLQGVVLRHPVHPRHGHDGLSTGGAVQHKHGVNEMVRRQMGFPHQASHGSRAPVAARTLRQIVGHAQGFKEFNSFTNPSSSARMACCRAKWSASDKSSMDS